MGHELRKMRRATKEITTHKFIGEMINQGKKGRLRVRNSRSLYVKRIAPLLPFALFFYYFKRDLHEMALLPYGFVSHSRLGVLVGPAAEHWAAKE
jgi:hypothetical protein